MNQLEIIIIAVKINKITITTKVHTDSEFVKVLMEISNSINMFFSNLYSFEEDIKSLSRFHYLKSAKNTLESSFNSLYNSFIYPKFTY